MSDTLNRVYQALEDTGVASRDWLQHVRSQGDPRFAEDIKADSLDMVDVYFAIEEEFGIKLPDDTPLAKTVGELVKVIEIELRLQHARAQ